MDSLAERVASFDRWHYQIDLGDGVVTPVVGPKKVANRMTQRRRLFFDRLLSVTGGTLEGMRVLDLGCNAGFWSLCAIEAGADFVFGVDARKMHVDQANLVFEAKGIDPSRYRFEVGDILAYPFDGFDVVLCLGILYHVSSPIQLFSVMASTGAELLVVDTAVSTLEGNAITLAKEPTAHPRNAIEESLVCYPTRGAVAMMAARVGYETVALSTACIDDYKGLHEYESGGRVAFICSRGRSLGALPVEVLPRSLRPGPAGATIRFIGRMRRRASHAGEPEAEE
jgi:tRNA (mo5U34)-methyltransferase